MTGIPQVKKQLLTSTLQSMIDDPDLAKEHYMTIARENPVLMNLIKGVLQDKRFSDDFREGYCKAALQFYFLIAAQMECNEWEESNG